MSRVCVICFNNSLRVIASKMLCKNTEFILLAYKRPLTAQRCSREYTVFAHSNILYSERFCSVATSLPQFSCHILCMLSSGKL